ncbi:MAG TPA: copper chaperone PCu(A)C [Dehalococcoidia bacterium]|nr:copper chaperone PCu(A)C [Dehalococcoidia bacterium]
MRRIGFVALVAALAAVAFAAVACGGEEAETPTPTTAATRPPATEEPAAPPEAPGIVIEDAWARQSPMGQMGGGMGEGMQGTMAPARGAAYMVIRNTGTEDDALIGASSDVAMTTEVHESYMEGDTMMMRRVDRIEIPAGGEVVLEPGGYHVMFIDLKEPLQAGTTIEITLEFEKAGEIAVQAEVREQ